MKWSSCSILWTLITGLHIVVSSAAAPPSLFAASKSPVDNRAKDTQQFPMDLDLPSPPHVPDESDGNRQQLTISDVLPRARNINIFASLTRDVSSVSSRLQSGDAGDNTTLLAPLNSAMQALPRKPWENRLDDYSGISAANSENKAAENLQRFVREHVVPVNPWKSGKENKARTIGGQELWWEERNGEKLIMPGEIVVDRILDSVNNGEIWALRGVINYV